MNQRTNPYSHDVFNNLHQISSNVRKPTHKDTRHMNSTSTRQFYSNGKTAQLSPKNNLHGVVHKKGKLIEKQPKGKEKIQMKKNPQIVLKSFKRKMFPQMAVLQNRQNFIEYIRVYDWIMEGSCNLRLSKDAFYMGIYIIRWLFTSNFLKITSEKKVELYAATIISIVAKVENALINYPEAIYKVTGKRLQKEHIIQSQLLIMKALNFSIPYKTMLTEELISICNEWDKFIKLKNIENIDELELSSENDVKKWSCSSQQKFKEVCTVFDAIMMHDDSYQIEKEKILFPFTYALFAILNNRTKQFYPLKVRDKTHLLILFQTFLTEVFDLRREKISIWMGGLVSLRCKLKIIENVEKILSETKLNEDQDLLKQKYRNILNWI